MKVKITVIRSGDKYYGLFEQVRGKSLPYKGKVFSMQRASPLELLRDSKARARKLGIGHVVNLD